MISSFQDHMGSLLDALRTQDGELARAWSKSEHWATLEHFMAAQGKFTSYSRHDVGLSFIKLVSTKTCLVRKTFALNCDCLKSFHWLRVMRTCLHFYIVLYQR